MRTITIDPITRVEGHGKITLHLNDAGTVEDSQFHVTQIRGFEKFCEGRPFYEMPSLMARICGICPVSHLLASSKACDSIMAVRIPTAARKLREMVHMGQTIQSHALSFYHLSAPDLLLGMDADPAKRNVVGLVEKHPEIARQGILLRKFGQRVIEGLAAERVHPSWIVPGGVSNPLDPDLRDRLLAELPDVKDSALRTLDLLKSVLDNFKDEIAAFGNFPSLHMGTVDEDGFLDLYDGGLRFKDAEGEIVADHIRAEDYVDYIGEAVVPWSYLKMPYFKPMGYPDGLYRVGPLGRMNVIDRTGCPASDHELEAFRDRFGPIVSSSFHFHYARLIELLYAVEKLGCLLKDPDVLGKKVRANAEPNCHEGVGIIEAPRGTLVHHYKVDDDGLMTWANLIVATGNNNLAMNRSVQQVAEKFVKGAKLKEGMLNRIEAVIRAYDPCLSCSTHAVGQMPLEIQLLGPDGSLVDRQCRDSVL